MKPLEELKVLTAEEQVAITIAHDAKRVRWLSWLTVTALVLAALFSAYLFAGYQLMYQDAIETKIAYEVQNENAGVRVATMTPEQHAVNRTIYMNTLVMFALRLSSIVGFVFAIAAIATVSLIRVTQRATLRQIQASLADIAKQLDALQK